LPKPQMYTPSRLIEFAKMLRKLRDEKGWTTEQLAREIRHDLPFIEGMMALLDLPQHLQDAVHQGELGWRQALRGNDVLHCL
jgi:hypothetical protein